MLFWLVFLFFAVLVIFNDSFNRPLVYVFSPVIKFKKMAADWCFSDIKKENSELKEKIESLKAEIFSCQYLQKENSESSQKYIFGSVISRPPQSPYDVLVIDIGSENGVSAGMEVTAYGDILLGHVAEVFPKISKVKLVSFPKEETNALIQLNSTGEWISVNVVGIGGENFEIKLPSTLEIKSGDQIITTGTHPLLLGVVEKIEVNLSESMQKIFFRLPVNLQYLRYAYVADLM